MLTKYQEFVNINLVGKKKRQALITNMAIIEKRIHLFPSRTQKLSSSSPMVLGPQGPGRVGRSQLVFRSSSTAEQPAVNR